MPNEVVIAIAYDFDKTLSPEDMPNFKLTPDIVGAANVEKFWHESHNLSATEGADKVLTYMYLLQKKARESGKPLTHDYLKSCGECILYFSGVETWFERVNHYAESRGARVEHYIISSGLRAIVEGTSIGRYFNHIYACDYLYDEKGEAVWPRLAINYTNKTQYLFRVSKGTFDVADETVNEPLWGREYHVPFENMVYFGDGLTDVPCMSLLKSGGGFSVAVYTEKTKEEAKRLAEGGRVNFVLPADYSEGSEAETVVFRLIDKLVADSRLKAHYSTVGVKK